MQCASIAATGIKTGAILICVPQPTTSWTAFISPALVFVSAIIAYVGIRNVRAVARQRATLDFIEKVESTPHYRTLNDNFSRLRRGPGFDHLHDPQTADDQTDRSAIQDYLNHYEMVAIGIRNNILDARIYRDWMLGAFVRDWNAASDWVQRERWKWDETAQIWTYHDKLYVNYGWAACAWSKAARRLDRHTTKPPQTASGPGDEAMPGEDARPDRGLGLWRSRPR